MAGARHRIAHGTPLATRHRCNRRHAPASRQRARDRRDESGPGVKNPTLPMRRPLPPRATRTPRKPPWGVDIRPSQGRQKRLQRICQPAVSRKHRVQVAECARLRSRPVRHTNRRSSICCGAIGVGRLVASRASHHMRRQSRSGYTSERPHQRNRRWANMKRNRVDFRNRKSRRRLRESTTALSPRTGRSCRQRYPGAPGKHA